jgi:peptidoglycan/xylan/chitin deacetylase (PgdA/CDA1 family)
VPVLLYHRVIEGGQRETFAIERSMLEQHLNHLAKEKYETLLSEDYVAILEGRKAAPARAVVLTFDDWFPEHFQVVRPLLARFGFRAIFFVITDKAQSPAEQEKLRILEREGHEIASHTVHHYFLTQSPCDKGWKCCAGHPCSDAQIESELRASRETLEGILGHPVTSFAWPGNFFDARVTAMAKAAGYRAIYAVERQENYAGVLTNLVGQTKTPEVIFRTEISGHCDARFFSRALEEQRCCVVSERQFHRYCVPQHPEAWPPEET